MDRGQGTGAREQGSGNRDRRGDLESDTQILNPLKPTEGFHPTDEDLSLGAPVEWGTRQPPRRSLSAAPLPQVSEFRTCRQC